ncbi:MAG TPA: extracellular solute-binding protein, partial [Chloroflexota bacterium]|nr:extracellular solute-binding protein [Chloroflexota bacterium]
LFQKEFPWIKVEEVGIPGGSVPLVAERLVTMAAGGTPPEVGWLHPSYVTDLAEKGILADVTGRAQRDREAPLADFYPGILDHFRHKNGTYGLPWNSGPTVTFFNRTLLDRLGIKAPDAREKEGRWDWNALRDVARAATQGAGDLRTMGLQGVSGNLDWFDAWLWQAGGDVFSKDLRACLLNQPPAAEAAQFLVDLYTRDIVVPVGDAARLFVGGIESGGVALRIGIKGQVNQVTERARQANFRLGMAPVPRGRAGRATRDGPQAFGLLKEARQPDAGWDYVRFMAGLETQKVRFGAKVTVPVRKAAAKLPEFAGSLEPWEAGDDWIEAAAATRNLPKPARYAEIDRTWLETWTAITSGQAPVRSALDDVTRQINAML